MKSEMMKGYIDAIILSIIAGHDSYGYEIAQIVNHQTGGALELKEGTLYPALRRLEAEHWIEGYWGDDGSGPRRRYYRITTQGHDQLAKNREAWKRNQAIVNTFLGGVEPT
ncbi:PadR family transcriptional regulator [Alicyclobacillus shizuokensis]|uniref:PadR family transcriptional regulator n=1 Tax=Alicyclobacillus shizuokensis TaxID=392014 RepID=UPI00082BF4B3|nr:PadR family transcriptional regulator [Alicyclobacillus shizuokensis]